MRRHLLPVLFILAAMIMWLVFYQQLPNELPIHWSFNGEANGYSTKFHAMAIFIGSMVFMYVLLVFIPRMDPKKDNYRHFTKGYSIINIALLVVLFAINLLVIFSGLGYKVYMGNMIGALLGLFFIVIGNYLPQIKPNYFVGIKTPWALYNEDNWRKTHRFGGKTYIISGLLFVLTAFLPNGFVKTSIYAIAFILLFIPATFSYWIFRKQVNG